MAGGTHVRVIDAVLVLVASKNDESIRYRVLRADNSNSIARVAGQERVPARWAGIRRNDERAPRVETLCRVIHDDLAAIVRPRLIRWRVALHGIWRSACAQYAVRRSRITGGSRWRPVHRVALRISDAQALALREILKVVLQETGVPGFGGRGFKACKTTREGASCAQ